MTAEIIELQSLRELRRQSRASPRCMMTWQQAGRLEQLEAETALPTISTQAEFDALAPGAEFRGPDGKKRQKPA